MRGLVQRVGGGGDGDGGDDGVGDDDDDDDDGDDGAEAVYDRDGGGIRVRGGRATRVSRFLVVLGCTLGVLVMMGRCSPLHDQMPLLYFPVARQQPDHLDNR